jgi:hypothetical protein
VVNFILQRFAFLAVKSYYLALAAVFLKAQKCTGEERENEGK